MHLVTYSKFPHTFLTLYLCLCMCRWSATSKAAALVACISLSAIVLWQSTSTVWGNTAPHLFHGWGFTRSRDGPWDIDAQVGMRWQS